MVLEMYQQLHPRNQTGASQTQGFPVIYTICIKKFEPPQYQSAVTAQSLALLSPLSSGSAVAIFCERCGIEKGCQQSEIFCIPLREIVTSQLLAIWLKSTFLTFPIKRLHDNKKWLNQQMTVKVTKRFEKYNIKFNRPFVMF